MAHLKAVLKVDSLVALSVGLRDQLMVDWWDHPTVGY